MPVFRHTRPWLFCLLLAACPLIGFGQSLQLDLATESVLRNRLEQGVRSSETRQGQVETLFRESGCALTLQKVDKAAQNVICRLEGETDSLIVVGAHYDFVAPGQGIVDDWSGVALLPSLYDALRNKPRKHTYLFVAFAAEEKGLVGSKQFVKQLPKEQRQKVQAFVNLECLGLASPKVWASRATPALLQHLLVLGKSMQIPIEGINVDQIGNDDSQSFVDAKIPVLTLHSLTQETLHLLHSKEDQLEAVHLHDYYDAFRLTAFFLAYLDIRLP